MFAHQSAEEAPGDLFSYPDTHNEHLITLCMYGGPHTLSL